MATDTRHSLIMKLNDDVYEMLQAIKKELMCETDTQTVRLLIKLYKKQKK